MNNEPRAVDPPEILAIKRAFGKLPSKLTYKDGVIRFKYLRPIDILPGAAIIVLLIVPAIKVLIQGAIDGGLSAGGVILLSISLGPIYLFLQWLLPRWGATAVLTREGIGLEKSGKLIQFYKWIQINKMSIGRNSNSPITFWSSTGILGSIPLLLTVYSFTTKKYHDLQGAILTAFAKESAPYYIDMENDHKLTGQKQWVRPMRILSLPITAAILAFFVGPFLFRYSEFFAYLSILVAIPWLIIGSGVFLLSIMDLSKMKEQRHFEPLGQIASIGNSNLQFDLEAGYLSSICERHIYTQMRSIGQNIYSISIAAITASGILFFLSILILSSSASAEAKTIPILMTGALFILFITMSRQTVLTGKSFDCQLIFDQDQAFVLRNGELLPIESFGSKKQSYEEFKHNPKLSMGVLRVNLKDHSRYFSTSSMVSLSDQEIMEFLPDENRL